MQKVSTANTILYCKKWDETVLFYGELLNMPVNFSNDWFVEFRVSETARLSIADEKRASIKSCENKGITLAWEVEDIKAAWDDIVQAGLHPTEIKKHAWGAEVFYLLDPEGHRIEFWKQTAKELQ